MENTIRRLTKVLGASQVETSVHDVRFGVEDEHGAKLQVIIERLQQRVMITLTDAQRVVRTSIDMAPVSEAFEEPDYPGRVSLRVGNQLLHLDTQPNLVVELESIPPGERSQSQRMRAQNRAKASE